MKDHRSRISKDSFLASNCNESSQGFLGLRNAAIYTFLDFFKPKNPHETKRITENLLLIFVNAVQCLQMTSMLYYPNNSITD